MPGEAQTSTLGQWFQELDPLKEPRVAEATKLNRPLVILWAATIILFLLPKLFTGSSLLPSDADSSWVVIVLFVVTTIAVIASYVLKRWVIQSEWSQLLGNAAAADETAFGHIVSTIEERDIPFSKMRLVQVGMGGGRRTYLRIDWQEFVCFVTCFAQGDDLFIGWNYFWSLSRLGLLLNRLQRFVDRNPASVVNKYLTAKALRDAVDLSTKTGIDAALGEIPTRQLGELNERLPTEIVAEARAPWAS